MKIAVPSDTPLGLMAQRSGHFGHCAYFTVCTIENDEITNVEVVPNVDHDAVGCGGVISFALSLGIDAILAAGMGMPPYTRFTNGGVKVYMDQTEPMVGKVISKFIAGEVPQMVLDDVCNHHNH